MTPQFLSPGQINHFIEHGYVILRGALDAALASQCVDRGFARLGYDRRDPGTWLQPRIHMPAVNRLPLQTLAPNAWAAACDLLGQDRIQLPCEWGDGFIMNFGIDKDKPWRPPGATAPGWHKDGDFFLHFLDSPEQALLSIVCWTDVVHQGGGTFIAPDSVGVVARFLADNPQGVDPFDSKWGSLIGKCREFIELTGSAGDVVLHHPFMLHAASQNLLSVERAITNPPIHFREPMNFNRDNPADFNAVERGVLRGLGVERLDFKPTSPRRRIVPPRIAQEQKMLAEEKARAAAKAAAVRSAHEA